VQPTQHRSPSRGGEGFKRFYGLVLAAKSVEERIRAGQAVRAACLSWDETGWLMYCLLVPGETTVAQFEEILGEEILGFLVLGPVESPYYNSVGDISFGLRITALKSAETEQGAPPSSPGKGAAKEEIRGRIRPYTDPKPTLVVRRVTLRLVRPVGEAELRRPQRARWEGAIKQAASRPAGEVVVPDFAVSPEMQQRINLFCSLYKRALSASDVSEGKELARELHASALADEEKAWLVYSILDYGLKAAEADEIAGPLAGWYDEWPTLVNPLERDYEVGVKVTLSRPDGPVEKSALSLSKVRTKQ
jgi:hypothetical protein